MERPTRVALTGLGSVGQALAAILLERPQLAIALVAVADRSGHIVDREGIDPWTLLEAKSRGPLRSHPAGREGPLDRSVLGESGAEILVEAASTNLVDGEPGWSFARLALESRLHLVLASKGPLVTHWDELFRLAHSFGRRIRFSATHGAPLPALDMARFGLAGSEVSCVRALLNSTTGLILERMEAGASPGEASEAVGGVGVAETDPRLDIEGWDAAAKCVILARALFGYPLGLAEVRRRGIEDLTTAEVQEAASAGTPIKLLSRLDRDGPAVVASVAPNRLGADDPLWSLRKGALGIVYEAEPVGRMLLAAYGAGGRATAAAIIRDIVSLREGGS